MRKVICLFAVFFLFSLVLSLSNPLAAPYYEGKRITITVGYPTGGGYDLMARVFARFLPKYIPGKPLCIVENIPGASGLIAANNLYTISKPDGLTISIFERSLPFSQLLKTSGLRLDMRKVAWIGSAAVEPSVLAVGANTPYKTVYDLKNAKEPAIFAAGGMFSSAYQFTVLAKDYVGLNMKIIVYAGGFAECLLAIQRNEADGTAGSYGGVKRHVDSGLLRLVLRSRTSQPGIENLPVNEDLTQDQGSKTIMQLCSTTELIGRPFVAPPGTPDDIMKILRDAFSKVIDDPEVKEAAAKIMMTLRYVPWDECLKSMNYILNQPDDIAKELGKYMKF